MPLNVFYEQYQVRLPCRGELVTPLLLKIEGKCQILEYYEKPGISTHQFTIPQLNLAGIGAQVSKTEMSTVWGIGYSDFVGYFLPYRFLFFFRFAYRQNIPN